MSRDSTAHRHAEKRYPRKVEIQRVIDAVRTSGFPIGSIRFPPDGTIIISEAPAESGEEMSEFDRWDAAGRL